MFSTAVHLRNGHWGDPSSPARQLKPRAFRSISNSSLFLLRNFLLIHQLNWNWFWRRRLKNFVRSSFVKIHAGTGTCGVHVFQYPQKKKKPLLKFSFLPCFYSANGETQHKESRDEGVIIVRMCWSNEMQGRWLWITRDVINQLSVSFHQSRGRGFVSFGSWIEKNADLGRLR